MPVYEKEKGILKPKIRQKEVIKEHYRENLEDYLFWSPSGNMHFGYWLLASWLKLFESRRTN